MENHRDDPDVLFYQKSISRSTVDLGYRRAVELMNTAGEVRGPKKLGIPGAGSYLYPMLIRFGVIRAADPHSLLQTP